MRFDALTIASIVHVAEAAYPYEGCGVVRASGEVQAIPNRFHGSAAGRVRFEMDPVSLLRALREGPLAAVFHSHCDAPAELSPEDVRSLSPDGIPLHPGALQVVVSVERGRAQSLAAYRWRAGAWRLDFSADDTATLQLR